MNWKLVDKSKSVQPTGDDYTKWKEQIAKECYYHCVYCAIPENAWGGIDHYHIDHYRPKSLPQFEHLELDIKNLFLACPICNRFKSNDWPGDPAPDYSNSAYPDPSVIDYSSILALTIPSFTINGKNNSAQYVVERLYLNRPQLVYERREHSLKHAELILRNEVFKLAMELNDNEILKMVLIAINKLTNLLHERENIRPYKLAEIRKIKQVA